MIKIGEKYICKTIKKNRKSIQRDRVRIVGVFLGLSVWAGIKSVIDCINVNAL